MRAFNAFFCDMFLVQLQPTSIWLRSAYFRRVFLTNESGDFDLTSVTEYSGLEVEGVAITTHADQPQLSATSLTLSSMGPSGNDSPGPSSVGFTSVINGRPPTARTRTSARKRKFSNPILAVSSFTLKVVVARIVSGNEEKIPVFQKYDQVFIPMEESSATLPFVLAAVRDQVGDEYIIVTPDGLEVRDSAGTRGTLLHFFSIYNLVWFYQYCYTQIVCSLQAVFTSSLNNFSRFMHVYCRLQVLESKCQEILCYF